MRGLTPDERAFLEGRVYEPSRETWQALQRRGLITPPRPVGDGTEDLLSDLTPEGKRAYHLDTLARGAAL